jgi:hypothetical protein
VTPLSDIDLDDYLIDTEAQAWGPWLAPFAPPLPPQFDLFLVSRFLDVFLIYPDGSVNWLEVQSGRLTPLAPSREEFEAGMETEYPHWLMTGAVDALVARGMKLGPGQCYAFKAPPILGGAYDIENVEVSELKPTLRVLGEIFVQAMRVPAGSRVTIGTTQ